MPADRTISLAALRKLARQALGADAGVCEFYTYRPGCEASADGLSMRSRGSTKQAARRQLHTLLERLVRGEERR